MALSAKQKAFIDEYFRCNFNATEAYSRAYPKSSRDAARAHGARLVANGSVDAEIKRRIAEQVMGPDEVQLRLAEQARAEYSRYITPDGTVNVAQMVAEGKGHLIKAIKETQFARNIEFHDAQAALVQIAKINGLLTDKTEHSGETILRVVYGDERTDDPSA